MSNSYATETFLKRAGGSLAKFTGKSLEEIAKVSFAGRRKFVLQFIDFLKEIQAAGYDPSQAKELVTTFLMFADTPQAIAGGTLEVGGRIDNVRETEMGIDVAIEFSAPSIPVLGGIGAGLDAGFSYRTLDREQSSQNFRSFLQWSIATGVDFTPEQFVKAAEVVLASTDIEIPELDEEEINDSSDLLTSTVVPFLTGLLAPSSP